MHRPIPPLVPATPTPFLLLLRHRAAQVEPTRAARAACRPRRPRAGPVERAHRPRRAVLPREVHVLAAPRVRAQSEEGHVRLAQPLERVRGDANCAQPDESRGSTHAWC
eukprot:scaffold77932_cov71-Phaeocystis_antarctica.AAC.1